MGADVDPHAKVVSRHEKYISQPECLENATKELPDLDVKSGSWTGKPVEHSTPQTRRGLLGISPAKVSTIRMDSDPKRVMFCR